MHSVDKLDPFIGKTVVDIAEYDERDIHQLNHTFIKITFDDDSFVCFPGPEFWFKFEE